MLIDAKQSALLVVDVQGRLVPAISGWQALLDQVVWLIRVARRMGVPVFACEQYPQGLGPTHPLVAAELPPEGCVAGKLHFSAVAGGCHGLRFRWQPSATGGLRHGKSCLRDADRARTATIWAPGLRRRGSRRIAPRLGQGACPGADASGRRGDRQPRDGGFRVAAQGRFRSVPRNQPQLPAPFAGRGGLPPSPTQSSPLVLEPDDYSNAPNCVSI
jgi:hypothetical protein